MKPSRRQLNKRCPCGSGKAFKNCHGQEFLLPKSPRVPRYNEEEDPLVTPPGYTYLTRTFSYEGEDNPRTDPRGEPGEYEAIFTLLQSGQAAERVKQSGTTRIFEIQDDRIVGDSHLALSLPKDARPSPNAEIRLAAVVGVDRLDGNADDVEMVLLPNDEGRLSKVSVKLNAQNFSDA